MNKSFKLKNKKGFTLLELILVMGVMGLVLMLFPPLINSFIQAQKRLQTQAQVDGRLNEVVDFIKDDVKNSKSVDTLEGNPIAVYLDNESTTMIDTEGSKVVINTVESDGNEILIEYFLEGDELKIRTDDGSGESAILEGIEKAEFRYKDKILLIYFKLKVPEGMEDKVKSEVRDIAITKINQN